MTPAPPPDWAALYQKHREAMYRVAARTMRSAGLADQADDVVMAAMESLMKAPPTNVDSWEALMVQTTRRRALDILGSAAIRHAATQDLTGQDVASGSSLEDDVIEAVDRRRAAAAVWDKLSILDERHRYVAWEYVAKQRPRSEVAAALGVTGPRVSQMAVAALTSLKEALVAEGVNP